MGSRTSQGQTFARFLLLFVLAVLISRHFTHATAKDSFPDTYPLQTLNATQKYSSAAIAITHDGATLLVVNPDSNSLTFVDTDTNSVLEEIPVGIDPRSVAISPDGTMAYVANQGSDNLSIVNVISRSVVTHLTVGNRPVGVVLSPDGHLLAVAELGVDQVRLLNTADMSTLFIVTVADRPHGLAFTPDSRYLLVSHLLSGEVTRLTIQPFTTYLPLTAKTSSGMVAKGNAPPSAAYTLITTIYTWPNIAPSPAVIVNASGTRAYLPQTMANGLGFNVQFDATVFPKVSVLNLETNIHQSSEHISLPETDRPVGLPWDAALSRGDTELWIVNSASNDVSVVDLSTPVQPSRVAHIPVGSNPRGIAITPDGDTAYVNNILDGKVTVIDAKTYSITQLIAVTTLPLPPVLLHGKQLFFSSDGSDIARARWVGCNTCHIEGEQDGRTWLLPYLGYIPPGEQQVIRRNTTSLLGMIETYPLRWSAEWDESADSEFSIRFEQFGNGLIDGILHPTLGTPNQGRSYDLDCLALFIDSLSVPSHIHMLSLPEQDGKVIFESRETRCTECHPAPLYTDFQVHDVSTADGSGEWFGPLIDTPTLRFLYDSAPYLHDGSAETLRDVLTVYNPGDKHGVTSHLTDQELNDLVAFLSALPFTK